MSVNPDAYSVVEILTHHLGNVPDVKQQLITMAQPMNHRRNVLMGTKDGIDSYDVCRGLGVPSTQNAQLRTLLKAPEFPYMTDPDVHIKTDGINFTPGAKAALTAYYKTFADNVSKQTAEQVNQSLVRMKLTPTARVDIGRQLLVTEVDRRINQEIHRRQIGQVTFVDLLRILGTILQENYS